MVATIFSGAVLAQEPAAEIDSIRITSDPTNGEYYVNGDTLEVSVTFTKEVMVTETPRIKININDEDDGHKQRTPRYDSTLSTDGKVLKFTYTIKARDFDFDGVHFPANPIQLNYGGNSSTIVNADDHDVNAIITHSKINDRGGHKIHSVKPRITSTRIVSTPDSVADGYAPDETIQVAVTYDMPVRVIDYEVGAGEAHHIAGGTPAFRIRLETGEKQALYSGPGNDNSTLLFDYTVRAGDYDEFGLDSPSYAVVFLQGMITRVDVHDDIARWIDADRVNTSLTSQSGHKVNVDRPTISSVAVTSVPDDATAYTSGETIDVTVTFSKAVNVDTSSGTPQIHMKFQSAAEGAHSDHYLDYASGSGSAELIFQYTVQSVDADDNGIVIDANSISLNGSTIRSFDKGADSLLTHAAPTGLSDHKIVADAGLVEVTASFDAATYTVSEDGATEATVTVNLSADPERELNIAINASGPRASDYRITPSTVQILSGSTSGTFKVKALDDDFDEDDETIALAFDGLPTGVTAGSQATATVTIEDDDTRGVIYSTEFVRINDGVRRVDDVFTVRLASQPTQPVLMRLYSDPDPVDIEIMTGGSLSFEFDGSDWDQPQTVKFNNVQRRTSNGENYVTEIVPRFEDTSDYRNFVPDHRVEVTIVDLRKPRVDSARIRGDSLKLTYDQVLDADSVPATDDFDVSIDNTAVDVSDVAISGDTLTLTLAVAAESGETVTLSYTVPSANPIQDEDANEAAALTDQAVTNNTAQAVEDSSLSALSLTDDSGTTISLSPVFASDTTSYTATVTIDVGEVTVAATAADSSATVAFTPSNDVDTMVDDHQVDLDYGDTTVEVDVSTADGSSTTYTITIERPKPRLSLEGPLDVKEEVGTVTYTVTLDPAADENVVVDYFTEPDPEPGDELRAYSGEDFTAVSGSLTFAPGDTSKTFDVNILDDSEDELDQRFLVEIDLPSSADNAELSGDYFRATTIEDNDPEPTLSIADRSAEEGSPVAFEVSLSEVSGRSVEVEYTTSAANGDTATPDTDFTSVTSGTFTIDPGYATVHLPIFPIDDTHYEDDETFTITLSSPVNAVLSSTPLTAIGTIVNDDVLEQVTGVEAGAGDGQLTISWTAVVGAGGYVLQWKSGTESYSSTTSDGRQLTISSGATTSRVVTGLTNGTDYTFRIAATLTDVDDGAWSSEVTAAPVSDNSAATGAPNIIGEPHVGLELTARTNDIVDGNGKSKAEAGDNGFAYTYQWIRVDADGSSNPIDINNATNRKYTLVDADEGKKIKVKVDFTDDADFPETLTSAAFPANETIRPPKSDDDSLSALTLTELDGTTISLKPAFSTTRLNYEATVAANIDRITIDGTVNHAGATVAYLPSNDASGSDTGHQVDLNFGSRLISARVTAENGSAQTYRIVVTREPAQVSLGGSNIGNEDVSPRQMSVVLTPALDEPVIVDYGTYTILNDPSFVNPAMSDVDFTAISGSLTFAAGETQQNIEVEILEDTLDEEDFEQFYLRLYPHPGATNVEVVLNLAPIQILDNDDPPSIDIADASADEGDPVAFPVSLSAASGREITVKYSTSVKNTDSAVSGTDFTAVSSQTLTIAPGNATAEIPVATVEDTDIEAGETFTLSLAVPVDSFGEPEDKVTLSTTPLTAVGTIVNDDFPAKVSGVALTVGNAELAVEWDTATDAQGYRLQWKSSNDTDYSNTFTDNREALIAAGTTTHNLTGLTNDLEYTVRIAATHNVSGDGEWSDPVTATPVNPDSTGPALSTAEIDGDTLVLTYDEDLDSNSTPASGDFTVTVAGTTVNVSTVEISGATVTLTLASAVAYDDAVVIAYTVPATGPIQDASGNDAAALSSQTVTNNTSSTGLALTVSATSLAEDAGATTVTVTAELDGAARDAATIVTVAVGDANDNAVEGTDYTTVADFSLTITAGQTTGTADFTLTPTDDGLDEDDETLTVAGSTAAAVGLTVSRTEITITDDDTRGVTVSETDLTVPEGASASYTVVLDSQPTDDVTVTPAATGDASVTLGPALTFSTTDWNTAQTVTVTAAADDDAINETATVAHTVAGADYAANSVTAGAVAITVDDDETPPLLALNIAAVTGDNAVNIAEKADGFTISGDTGSIGGVSVTLTVGSAELTATSADADPATWSVGVPANAMYLTESSVTLTFEAEKIGHTSPSPVERTLAVDLTAPVAPTYTAPASLKVGAAITAMNPSGGSGINIYSASGLPTGLSIDAGTGAISGTPDAVGAAVTATVTASDTAGNSVEVDIYFPAVAKGDQALTGFAYSTNSISFGDPAPTVTAPTGAQGALSYAATPTDVCTVVASTGALTILSDGVCEITATAAGNTNYNQATATFDVTVGDLGMVPLNVYPDINTAIADDNIVNISEKASGFTISGDTGEISGVTVTFTLGSTELSATSSTDNPATWSIDVPSNAPYLTHPGVTVKATASKTGYTSVSAEGPLRVDLAAPTAPSYTAPTSLKVGEAITAISPASNSDEVDSYVYSASGLPAGLVINDETGDISGTPGTADAATATATVTVSDTAGNSTSADITFPAVAKGDQTLTDFAYSAESVNFGDTAPALTSPNGAKTTLSYSASPDTVCTVDANTGALALVGAGNCTITATAASDANYNEATAETTVTIQAVGTLMLNLDVIAEDDTINIKEKGDGFTISGDTGSEGSVSVTVTIGETDFTTTSSTANSATWSVSVPANSTEVTGTSVDVTVSAAKTGFTSASASHTLTVDLTAPTAPSYTAPSSMKVDVAITDMSPTSGSGIDEYSASGLPSGLSIDAGTGAISGTPDSAAATSTDATVTVSDIAGNTAEVKITFPAVAKGDQTLIGFEYSSASITFGETPPTLTAPTGARGTLSYSASPAETCTVDSTTGALTLEGAGSCEITVTAAATANYDEATDSYTVTVVALPGLTLSFTEAAGDFQINNAEKEAGFTISGTTDPVGGVLVTVTIGVAELTATSSESGDHAWSVEVPANAAYITGTNVNVKVSASKVGYTTATVEGPLVVDLVDPTAPVYTLPTSLKVGEAISTMSPAGNSGSDIPQMDAYSVDELPSGLSFDDHTGEISGTPDTANAAEAKANVTVSDTAGNTATTEITFPAVAKGDQTLSGFQYSSNSVDFGGTAPTVTAPSGASTALSYSATPATVCTVDSGTGALTQVGAGECVVTATAEATDNYNQATATYTVTIRSAGTLSLILGTIAEDDTINIEEKGDGLTISGNTGSESGVTVTVAIGSEDLPAATSSTSDPATWSVEVPPDASYITGASVTVTVSAAKTGFTSASIPRTLTVDLTAPTAPTWTVPSSLKVGDPVTASSPSGGSNDIAEYSATGLPSGLVINGSTGEISGEPDTADTDTADATVTITDTAGNSTDASITFPEVEKGDQPLSGFEYSASSITFGETAPTLTPPTGAKGALSYSASPDNVCTVTASGALTISGIGDCVITATAAGNANYNEAKVTYTVQVNAVATLLKPVYELPDEFADHLINIAEKASGFTIGGNTGTMTGVTVTVTLGTTNLTATSSDGNPATWSVLVPGDAPYLAEGSVDVKITAAKAGYTSPDPIDLSLEVDLTAPTTPSWTAPSSLKVDAAITAMNPSGGSGDIETYVSADLPSGLVIDAMTGDITGAPETANTAETKATVTVSDLAGNPATVEITFPEVEKGDQTLSGFEYSTNSVAFDATAPAVTAPTGAETTLSYSATPAEVCTVGAGDGALTLVGAGVCVITVTAASDANYNEATASYMVTIQSVGTLALTLDAIADDDTINIAEQGDGFAISGQTGSESGVSVTVTVGGTALPATTSSTADPALWSVDVPANATYISGASVDVTVSAAKSGFTSPGDVERTLTVDLTAPTAPSYTAPSSMKVNVAITEMSPTGGIDVAEYSAGGLPSGLSIDAGTGAISGTPDTAAATTHATVTVSDTAGNTAEVDITFPAVAKGDQTLTGFEYSAESITFGETEPTLTAPTNARGALSYSATPAEVCTVNSTTGALTILAVGTCDITVTAVGDADYNAATATASVEVTSQGELEVHLDETAALKDFSVNIADKNSGFTISGKTQITANGIPEAVGGVTVTLELGDATLTATSSTADPATWSITVPPNATYLVEPNVQVDLSIAKAGYTSPTPITYSLPVDLTAPTAPSYTAPSSLKVGEAINAMSPASNSDSDIDPAGAYSADGLPSGLSFNVDTGDISGTPGTADAATATATVTVSDTAGNSTSAEITFPAVAKGDQTLTDFAYSADSVNFGDDAPTPTAPNGAKTTLSFSATPADVCTVDSSTGALTLVGAGNCVVTATAASDANYNEAAVSYTVTVNAVDTLAEPDYDNTGVFADSTINIAEKTDGFTISGNTGEIGGVTVTVKLATATFTTTSSTNIPTTWSIDVPANADYLTEPSVDAEFIASKTGYTSSDADPTYLFVDLTAPTMPVYSAPASLKVGEPITAISPASNTDTDIDSYSEEGLPSGLVIDDESGEISGTPDVAAAAATVTVTVSDNASNTAAVDIAFPAVAKGDQTLAGFEYSASSVAFGVGAPTVTAPTGAMTALSYSATPAEVCTVDSNTGALTLVGAGDCVVTATAASDANYNEAKVEYTVSIQSSGTLTLTLDDIAEDDTVNIDEKADGFTISGNTGSEEGVSVTVSIGLTDLTATSADDNSDGTATWSVDVPENATYITGTSANVTVSVSKTGYTSPADVARTLTVDLTAPTAPVYSAPASLKVGVSITAISPASNSDTDIESYSAEGLPSGLVIDDQTGEISGAPDAAAVAATATVTVSDTAGNSVAVELDFPIVAKGDQTLAGFAYGSDAVDFSANAPTLTAPTGAQGDLSYSATPAEVCTVDSSTGALTLVGAGDCVITVTAASNDNYNEAKDDYTVTIRSVGALELTLDTITDDDTINIAEKAAGFTISGNTGSEEDVSVTVAIGTGNLTATSADDNGTATWSVDVPENAAYITGTSVDVTVSAAKTGYTSPSDEVSTLTVDLSAPTAPSWTAPATLKVGEAINAISPTGGSDVSAYSATGLPPGLEINSTSGEITGTPTTADATTATVTVTVSDTAGNSVEANITFPVIAKGDQTLGGFQYSTSSVTFGATPPAPTAPTGVLTTLSYSATPAEVCTVNASTGALTLLSIGDCAVTATAAADNNYNAASADYTVSVTAVAALVLHLDSIATDNVVNIDEKAGGFAISGDSGSVTGVLVTVTVGNTELTATSSDANPALWSVSVPVNLSDISGTSVDVTVSGSRTGYTPASEVSRTLTVDLTAPTAPSWIAPDSLKVGAAITTMSPSGGSDVDDYSAAGLPSGLSINPATGAISGTPDAANGSASTATVTVTDTAGNTATASIAFTAVDKGDQTLTGFAYDAASVLFGETAPAVEAPSGAQNALSYSASPAEFCSVDAADGALTLLAPGSCDITVTAAASTDYNEAAATFTVTIQPIGALVLNVADIAGDDTVNIAEKAVGFTISGDTGSVDGVSVTVSVGDADFTATSSTSDPAAWSVDVPADAAEVAGTSVDVIVNAEKLGYTAAAEITRSLTVDLTAPAAPAYTSPHSLKVGEAIIAMSPAAAGETLEYSAEGLPSGLEINAGTGDITGTPDTAAIAATATVTATDAAGNSTAADIAFPAVDKGDQTLTGFQYSASAVGFGNPAPTVTAPTGAQTALSYSAAPATVCSIDAATGALTLVEAGSCEITVTAAVSDNYNEASATFAVIVQPVGTLVLNLDAIAGDDIVNIAEKAAGFTISGNSGADDAVSVTVTVGTAELTATSSAANPALWSVDVPVDAAYIAGASVDVTVNATKTGFTSPAALTRTLTVALIAPTPPAYTAPETLKVGEAITVMTPAGGSAVVEHAAEGLPSGLEINALTGEVSGTPDTAADAAATAVVTVTDAAGNTSTADIAFPAVDKGDQTLTDFGYGANAIVFGDDAPALTVPGGALTELSYAAEPAEVCTVDAATGELAITGAGECLITVTAAVSDNYNEAAAEFTLTVQPAGTVLLNLDTIADDDTVNVVEKVEGFEIGGNTGALGEVSVTVVLGEAELTAVSNDSNPAAWSVQVPAGAEYITGESLDVSISAAKIGYDFPGAVQRTLTIDLVVPEAPAYIAPDSLTAGEPITVMTPAGGSDIESYSAEGLPSGLSINAETGEIGGAPDTVDSQTADAVVSVSDAAGNISVVEIEFPPVEKGDQILEGFSYSPASVALGGDAPALTPPSGAHTALTYSAAPAEVCSVNAAGALTLAGDGECVITATAAASENFNAASVTFSVTVRPASNVRDDAAPFLSSASIDGASLELNYNESLDTVSTPAPENFTVFMSDTKVAVNSVAIGADAVVLSLAAAAVSGETVQVTYSAPRDGGIRDLAGNQASGLSRHAVTNDTVSTGSTRVSIEVNTVSVPEDGEAAQVVVTASLNATPLAADTSLVVSVGDGSDSAGEGADYSMVDDLNLVIAAGELSGSASFLLEPVDDFLDETDESLTIKANAAAGLAVTGAAAVSIVDNDTRGFTVVETSLTLDEGGNATYTLALDSKPTAPVTVRPAADGSPDLSFAPASLTFSRADWHSAQTITISAAEDDDANHDSATVAHTAAGGDYAELSGGEVQVTVADDEATVQEAMMPAQVVNASADAASTHVDLVWDAVADTETIVITGYLIEASYDGGANWAEVASGIGADTTSYRHGVGLDFTETRRYRISAESEAGAGLPSASLHTNATSLRGGLTASVLTLEDAAQAIGLCWKPQGIATADLSDVAVAWTPTGSPDAGDLSALSWRAAGNSEGVDCEGGVGFRVTSISDNQRYEFHMRALHDSRWLVSNDADAVLVDRSKQLRAVVAAGLSGLSGDTPVPAQVCRNYDDPATPENEMGSFYVSIGFTTASERFLRYEPITINPNARLILENATMEILPRPFDPQLGYRLRITPTVWGEPVVIGVPADVVSHAESAVGNLASVEFRRETSAALDCDTGVSAPVRRAQVTAVSIESDGDRNGEWTAGEVIRATLKYDERLDVVTATGVPGVTLTLGADDSTEVIASFARVTAGDTLVFEHLVTEQQGPIADIALTADSLALNGGEINSFSGPAVDLAHASAVVVGGQLVMPDLSASWLAVPDRHQGAGNSFEVTLRFTEDVGLIDVIGEANLLEHAFTITGGAIESISQARDRSAEFVADEWILGIAPAGDESVTITPLAGRECGLSGAVCTLDDRALAEAPAAVIQGSALALSVADARVSEGPGAMLSFEVTLAEASAQTVTVDYATADGTATAAEDYETASGTLSFAPGETFASITVTVLDDSHDEGEETLTLTLSNAAGARIEDGQATGVIANSDPIPSAWLARFGRAASDHVAQAVSRRFERGPRENQTTLGGMRLDSLFTPESGQTLNTAQYPRATHASPLQPNGHPGTGGFSAGFPTTPATPTMPVTPVGARHASPALAPYGANMGHPSPAGAPNAAAQRPALRDALMNSSFFHAFGADCDEQPASLTAWGETATTRFRGAEGGLSLDGEVSTAMLGVDRRSGRWLFGSTVSLSEGAGGYQRAGGRGGAMDSTLTSINPYAHFEWSETVNLWGVLGYGKGRLRVEPEGADSAVETDLSNRMAAFGGRGLLTAGAGDAGEFELALRSDALLTQTDSAAALGLAAAQGATGRVRMLLEGSGSLPVWGGILRPVVEAGLRYDGGDAETGAGFELGGGLGYAIGRFTIELNARGLLAHEDENFREWGFSGSVTWQPRPDGLGFALRAGSTLGMAQSGVDALWSQEGSARGLAASTPGAIPRQYQFDLQYGLEDVKGWGSWTPFLGLQSGNGRSTLRAGMDFLSTERGTAGFEIGQQPGEAGADDYVFSLRSTWRF